jgi:RHS repeat-associated protein
MKKTLSTFKLPALARLFCLLGFALAAAAGHAVTLSESPSNVPPGGTVTATWSGIATPTSTDWLAFAALGAANTSYVSWRYTTGTASGSVPFTLPAVEGTFELRLFANNGYTRLATSNPFTVGTRTVSGTVTASGAALVGVAFAASNGGACTSSNASGQYTCTVPYTWSGSVTPSSSGYIFTPASRSYSNVVANQTAQDYTASITYVVSGTVTTGGSPFAGVAFAASNGGVCTSSNASGQYSCTVPQGYTGTVTPSLSTYAFTPASRSYSNVVANQTAQDYATVLVQVSGTLTLSGSPFAGAALVATSGGACTSSNAFGQYSCTVAQGWSGTVTPSASGYTFTPASRNYSNVAAGQSAQDFAGQAIATSAGIFYIHADHLNTPRLIANSTGTTVWRWDQGEPFGNDVPNNNPSGAGAFDFNMRFPGQYFDREAGLSQNLYRDYDPSVGRYVQSDPIGLRGGINTYAYVDGNPIAYSDSLGLQSRASKNISQSKIGKALQDLPDRSCDHWPAWCVKDAIVCLEAKCTRVDCQGNNYTYIVTAWQPPNPPVNDVGEGCVCTRWTGDKS